MPFTEKSDNVDEVPTATASTETSLEKYWSELGSNEEKIERMRPILKSSQNRIERLEKALRDLTLQLHSHSHLLHNGEPAMSLANQEPTYYQAGSLERDPDKVYI